MTFPPKNVVCVGAVVQKGDAVLLIRQAPNASLAGQWSVPWGIVEVEEKPHLAALRETEEEGGIIAEVVGLLGVQSISWQNGIGLAFLCRHLHGNPTPDGKETDKAAYFTLSQLDELEQSETVESWSGWLVRRVLKGEHTVVGVTDESPYLGMPAFL